MARYVINERNIIKAGSALAVIFDLEEDDYFDINGEVIVNKEKIEHINGVLNNDVKPEVWPGFIFSYDKLTELLAEFADKDKVVVSFATVAEQPEKALVIGCADRVAVLQPHRAENGAATDWVYNPWEKDNE